MTRFRLPVSVVLALCFVADASLCTERWADFPLHPYALPAGYNAFCLDESTSDCPRPADDSDPRDRDGLRRDTWYFIGYQVATIGILYMAPESVSGWTDEQKSEYSLSIWWENVTNPSWDSDDFYINYILHPYWGSAYYVRARERGYSGREAFWYSVLLSSIYEFGAEALFEEPSIQDLIVTPVFGSLLGKYFMGIRSNIRERELELGYKSTGDKWLWVLTDPLGSLNRQFDKWFGWEANCHIQPYIAESRRFSPALQDSQSWQQDRVIGVRFYLSWQ